MDKTPIKKEKRKRKRKYLIAIVVAEVLVIAGMLLWIFFAKPTDNDIRIKTPYTTMHFPGKWKDCLYTESKQEEAYRVSFYAVMQGAPNYHLFDICFGGSTGEQLGVLITDKGEEKTVWIVPGEGTDGSYSEDDYQIIYAMLDDANYLIEKLALRPVSEDPIPEQNPADTTTEPPVFDDLVIKTPYCDLIYPGRWSEQLRVDHAEKSGEYTVSFYAAIGNKAEKHLFDIILGKHVADCFAVIRTNDGKEAEMMLRTSSFEPDDSWSPGQIDSIYAMMDDLNVILENLTILSYPDETLGTDETEPQVTQPDTTQPQATQPDTTESHDTQPDSTEPEDTQPETVPETEPTLIPNPGGEELSGELFIDTPYGQLKYPEKWKAYLEVIHAEQKPYAVEFYCTLPQRSRELMFTIYIGGSAGDQIGTITDGNGQAHRVGVTSREFTPPADWSQAETEVYYLMLEDINYIIESLA